MYLRKFKKSELLFNKKETKGILKFIFSGTPKTQIDAITVSDEVRDFAQALLFGSNRCFLQNWLYSEPVGKYCKSKGADKRCIAKGRKRVRISLLLPRQIGER
ncbi:hypothetical protein JFQ74_001962 [Vibrio parahaemolyticus]|nr:hypothetical protein [Vibrio parahaemolyticus]